MLNAIAGLYVQHKEFDKSNQITNKECGKTYTVTMKHSMWISTWND